MWGESPKYFSQGQERLKLKWIYQLKDDNATHQQFYLQVLAQSIWLYLEQKLLSVHKPRHAKNAALFILLY